MAKNSRPAHHLTPEQAIAAYQTWPDAEQKRFLDLLGRVDCRIVTAFGFLKMAVGQLKRKLSRQRNAERDAEILKLTEANAKDVVIARKFGMTVNAVQQARRRVRRTAKRRK